MGSYPKIKIRSYLMNEFVSNYCWTKVAFSVKMNFFFSLKLQIKQTSKKQTS